MSLSPQNVTSSQVEFSTLDLHSIDIGLPFAPNQPQSSLLEYREETLIDIPRHFVFHSSTQLRKQLYLVMVYGDSSQVALLKKAFKKTYDIDLVIHAIVITPVVITFATFSFNPFGLWPLGIALIFGALIIISFIRNSKVWGHRTKSMKSREDYINLNQLDYRKYKEEEDNSYPSSPPIEITYHPNSPPEYEGNIEALPSYAR